MKFAVRLTAAALSWILLWNLAACSEPAVTPESQPSSQPTEVVLTAAEIYDAAKAALLSAPHRINTFTLTEARTVAEQTYTSSASGTASFSQLGTENMVAVVEEDLRYGTVAAEHLLSFCNGRAYSRISGGTFAGDMTAEAFVAQQLPSALIDTSVYESIEQTTNADGSVITFSQPRALESWVGMPTDTILVRASGTATLDITGTLVQTTYTADYTYQNVDFSLSVTLRCATPAQLELAAVHPEHPEDCVTLSCLDAPLLLLRAAGNIFSAQNISADSAETIYSQILPLARTRKSQLHISGAAETLNVQLSNTVSTKVYQDQPSTVQVYQFQNGVCTETIDNGEPAVDTSITAEDMRAKVEDTLLSALFATRYLAGATLTEDENFYRLDFAGNEDYCSDLTKALSTFLNLPMDGVTSHHSTQASGYLCIDKTAGLPVAMGMYFSRTHMFGDIPYMLSYQLDQVLTLSPAE